MQYMVLLKIYFSKSNLIPGHYIFIIWNINV